MASQLRGVEVLQSEIEKSRDRLKNFNENIKKLTGFENPGPRARRILSGENPEYDGRLGRGRGRLFGVAKRGLMGDGGPAAKRRVVGGAFSRLGPPPASARRREREESPYEDELPNKLSLQSSVVATSREAKNRDEILQEQTKDKEGMQRNRRMFGLLLGTLNKFKTESKSLESKEEQRKQIDKKLEENAEKEKKKFKQETKQLMEEMHLEETRISRLEQKMEVVQEHKDWEKEVKRLKNFICTKSKPRIFWLPRQLNSVLESKLKESNKVVDGILKDGQVRLEKEIQDVMERENKREERIKMRLREDGLFQEHEEKDNDSRKPIVERGENIEQGDGDDRLQEADVEEKTESKSKQKRRVVIEQDSDEGSESENDDEQKGQSKKSVRDSESLKIEDVSKRKRSVRADSDRGDDDKSDSNGDEDGNGRSVQISRAKISPDDDEEEEDGRSDKVVSSSKGRSKERRRSGEEDQSEEEEEVARVVMHRSSSKDKERTRKDKHRRDSGAKAKDRDDRKSSRDGKHSSRHSKRSRKEDDRLIIKQEREDNEEEKKKKKVSEKEEEDKGSEEEANVKSSRNPTTLIGEDDDVEMESEQNITM